MSVVAAPGTFEPGEVASAARRAFVQRTAKLLNGALDLGMVLLAMVAALRLRSVRPGNSPEGAESQHLLLGALSLPVWLGFFLHYRLYTARHVATRLEEFRRVVHAVGASTLAIAVAGFMLQWYVARGWLVLVFVCGVAFVMLERELVRREYARQRRNGHFLRRAVIAGANGEADAIRCLLDRKPELGYEVVTVLDDPEYAAKACALAGASTVIVATTAVDAATTNRLARDLTELGIHVELSSSLQDISAERLSLRPLGRFPVLYVEPVRRTGWRPVAKRAFDLVVAGGLLVAGAPFLALTALAIKVDSRGPVLFRQERVGKDGRLFRVLKFRTMVADAEQRLIDLRSHNEADGPLFKLHDDPRVTRVGAWLRKLSIDEVPQLWNVVRGEMSLVGPRPALASEMTAWHPELHNRLRVKPGITGMWQVSGRSDSSFEEYSRLDLYYVDNWSLVNDLAIVAKTVPTVLLRRGAY